MKELLFIEAIRGVLPMAVKNKLEDKIIERKIKDTYKLLKKIAKDKKLLDKKL